MAIGIQGLADTLAILKFPFESKEALKLNREIYETIYFGAMTASKRKGKRIWKIFFFWRLSCIKRNFAIWHVGRRSQGYEKTKTIFSKKWDWKKLKKSIAEHGLRNSLFIAQMPTGSTAQILGNNESFEPFTSNMYLRRVLSGEFIVVNKHLLKDLIKLGLWNEDMKNMIMANNGSVQIDRLNSSKTKRCLQNSLRDFSKKCNRHGFSKRAICRPESVDEYPHGWGKYS